MTNDVTNAVLAEQIKQLREDFQDFKKDTNKEIKEMELKVENTRRIADEVNYSVRYVQSAVDKMDGMMTNFIKVVGDQNEKIDAFINSDKRTDSKRNYFVSILQVIAGILIALIGMWSTGKM